ncbi:hypothetical protein MUCCIDRAFT_109523 [Mucor lusitanicus CBS 277.49]|uniref:Uncharacterized protein n=1 Tax=Mucor lusitanicus CBS 277.49 TaxID=747725 RepID=A0A162TMG2_MUCCL|nr:hypothetical protein MUCCIDRAFT_109523 [Mucor lusitanicus CBS 277.49]
MSGDMDKAIIEAVTVPGSWLCSALRLSRSVLLEPLSVPPSHFIRDFDPYRASWRVKTHVTQKSEIKKFNNYGNAKGPIIQYESL